MATATAAVEHRPLREAATAAARAAVMVVEHRLLKEAATAAEDRSSKVAVAADMGAEALHRRSPAAASVATDVVVEAADLRQGLPAEKAVMGMAAARPSEWEANAAMAAAKPSRCVANAVAVMVAAKPSRWAASRATGGRVRR